MKKILAILSNYGYWGIEFVGPMDKLEAAGYTIDIATPVGERPQALPPSMDPDYFDPPLGIKVNDPADCKRVKEVEATNKLDNPKNLKEWFPERPYFSHENFLRTFEKYYSNLEKCYSDLEQYDGLLIVGGSGPLVDMVNNQRVHDVVLGFLKADKPIGAICYGVAVLSQARDFNERKSIIRGKHVTGHCIEYDYKDGTGFINTDFNMGPPPYCLEHVLTDAVGDEGGYHGNFGKHNSVIVDAPFITARSLQDAHIFGDKMVDVLQNGLKKYGW